MPAGEVEFFGETFRLNHPEDYQFAMVEFAEVATGGADDGTLESLAAVMTFLRAAIAEDDFDRFRKAARKNKAQVRRDLMPLVVEAFTQEAPERPTGLPSGSSGGRESTAPKSVSAPASPDHPSLRVIRDLEAQGRPDKAQFVKLAMEASAS